MFHVCCLRPVDRPLAIKVVVPAELVKDRINSMAFDGTFNAVQLIVCGEPTIQPAEVEIGAVKSRTGAGVHCCVIIGLPPTQSAGQDVRIVLVWVPAEQADQGLYAHDVQVAAQAPPAVPVWQVVPAGQACDPELT